MRARQIRKLRKIISNPNYYKRRYEKILYQLRRWQTFYEFDCSEFFRGEKLAKYNQKKYFANVPRLEGKLFWYERRIDFTKNKLYQNDV